MKVTLITQGGLLFENDRIKILVDPYLSDSVGKLDESKHRRIPVDESLFDVQPDVILITHNHLDHLDPETLERYLCSGRAPVTVLAGEAAYLRAREFGGGHNYVLLSPHCVWSEKGITFYSVRAAHSDTTAVGFIIDDGEKTYYVSGDTLYNFDVIDEVLELVEDGVDFAFVPINGKGNNMNAKDAADFVYEIDAKRAVPLHYGLFDNIDPETFDYDSTMTLEPFKTVEI